MRFVFALAGLALFAQAPPVPSVYQPAPEERQRIEQKAAELDAALKPLRSKIADDLVVDAEVYLKAAKWILRYNEFYTKAYVNQAATVLETGLERARELAAGKASWPARTGSFSRAYRSRVDGSIQPYAVTIPANYNPSSPEWLEVVLHGRGATLNEVSFLYSHDRSKPATADHQFIRLDVFGRGNNAYRWAGETDVFEAIDSVRNRYNIDPVRIVLRGFSMGGAGAWHLGLHYPDKWAAVEAGAGFVETKVHAKIADPPRYTRIYDALYYALNAVDVPMVGYGGEDDPQLRASVFIRQELGSEGYTFRQAPFEYRSERPPLLFLIGPKTQHSWHPKSKTESDQFLLFAESRGTTSSQDLRFVTYTERYNSVFGITIDQLERQYERAQVDSKSSDDGVDITTKNVARISLHGEPKAAKIRIDGHPFRFEVDSSFERANGAWRTARPLAGLQKVHGLQGPIDDAFMESFLCLKPAVPQSASPVHDFAVKELDRMAVEFPQWMRGDVPVKESRDVTADDIRSHHIAVFGTPATNPLVARAVNASPLRWTASTIKVGGRSFDAATHMLSMIYPNPENPKRYIVVNSGHTFHAADFRGTNALLYPRVGDWAVTDIQTGEVVAEGVFDRHWQLQ